MGINRIGAEISSDSYGKVEWVIYPTEFSYADADLVPVGSGLTYGEAISRIRQILHGNVEFAVIAGLEKARVLGDPRLLDDLGLLFNRNQFPSVRREMMLALEIFADTTPRRMIPDDIRVISFRDTGLRILRSALDDPSHDVAIAGALSLFNLGDTVASLSTLEEIAESGDPRAIDNFYRLILEGNSRYLKHRTFPESARGLILKMADSTHDSVSIVASFHLAQIGDAGASFPIARRVLLGSDDLNARLRALDVLAIIGDEPSLDLLRGAESDPSIFVRARARHLIGMITGAGASP